jgi:hypothetical protein
MPEIERSVRTKAWLRAVTGRQWEGPPGKYFREVVGKLLHFGRDKLKLRQRTESLYEAGWARAEGSFIGKDQAEALERFQKSEHEKISVALKKETFDDDLAQARAVTDKLRAEIDKVKSETAKNHADATKSLAEAGLLRAQATQLKVNAAIQLIDRLVQEKVWLIADNNGALHLVSLPPNADVSQLFEILIPNETLEGLQVPIPKDDSGSEK